MRFLWVFLAVLMVCGVAVGFELNARSAPIVSSGSGTDTIYFLNPVNGDTLDYVNGFSLWGSASCSLRTAPYMGGNDTIPATETIIYVPKEGITISGATAWIEITNTTQIIYGYGWTD